MADVAGLVSNLKQTLTELDYRVASFRSELAVTFHRYSRNRLAALPNDTVQEVDRVISRWAADLPNLGPAFGLPRSSSAGDSPVAAESVPVRKMKPTRGSPPPRTSIDSDDDDDDDGDDSADGNDEHMCADPHDSDHDSEVELRGLFTPSYLPLLGSDDKLAPRVQSKDSLVTSPIRSGGVCSPISESLSTPDASRSHSRLRRSAMRLSSGTPKSHSPRRVRFDVEGSEVLPTMAPSAVEQYPSQPSVLLQASSPVGISLLGDDEGTPPPKKVSSSQALRALSRTPLDAGTVWTVVNPITEDEPSEPGKYGLTSRFSPPILITTGSAQKHSINPGTKLQLHTDAPPNVNSGERRQPPLRSPVSNSSGSDRSSEIEFLSVAKSKSFVNKKPISPVADSPKSGFSGPVSPQWISSSGSTFQGTANSNQDRGKNGALVNRAGVEQEQESGDEEALFTFDPIHGTDESARSPFRSMASLSLDSEDEDQEDGEDDEDDDDENDDESDNGGDFDDSRGDGALKPNATTEGNNRLIPAGKKSSMNAAKSQSTTTTGTSPVRSSPRPVACLKTKSMVSGSFGSYKGRPVLMPVVSNPEVMTAALRIPDPNRATVAGIGRSAGSLKVDLDVTPRSLTERLHMEEALEARRKLSEKKSRR